MFTDISFTNMSLNIHRPNVTLFQKDISGNTNQLFAWKVIQHCHYQWTHPFRIDWAYEYQLFDNYGNFSPIGSLSSINKLDINNYGIRIDNQPNDITFTKTIKNKIMGINLLKNKRIIAAQKFEHNHQVTFSLSTKIYICADLRAKQGDIIHPDNLNISLKELDIYKKEKIRLMMKGGQPGALSEPLSFATY